MSVIPQTLAACRFNLVGKASKRAIEKGWPDDANYAIDDPKLLKWIEGGGNYGVLAKNGVCIVDCDSEELWAAIPDAWKESFIVKSGRDGPGGFHVYLACPEAPAAKFVFPDKMGDLRGPDSRFFVVGPGSIHEATKRRYEVLNDPGALVEVSWADLHAWIAAQKGEAELPAPRKDAFTQRAIETGKRLSDECGLRVEEFLMPENPKRSGNEIVGVHPIHGSDSGHNLYINPSKGTWHCFRCNSGGDALLAFAVARGIIDCRDTRPGALNDSRVMSEILTQLEKEGRKPVFRPDIAAILAQGADDDEDEPVEEGGDPGMSAKDRRVIRKLVKAAYNGQRGIAELYAKLYRGIYIFDASEEHWFRFANVGWTRQVVAEQVKGFDPIQEAMESAAIRLESLAAEEAAKANNPETSDAEQTAAAKRAKRLSADSKALYSMVRNLTGFGYRESCLKFAASSSEWLGVPGDVWDRNPWALGCANGVLDLKTGALRPGAPGDYIQSVCPTAYNPEARAPRWERFLEEIFDGDTEKVAFVRRLFGMALIGDAAHKQYLVMLVGKGRNGKDTFLKVINRVLGGDLCGKVSTALLLDTGFTRSAGAPSPEIMRLRGKRLVYAAETSEGNGFAIGRVKDLTGGGDLMGRAMYGRFEVQFPASHMIVLETNVAPVADAADAAFWYRVKRLDFNLSFVPEPMFDHERKEEKGLAEALLSESEGILAWLVEGCLEYQRVGLRDPPCVQIAVESYRRSVDMLQHFIDACIEESPQSSIGAAGLYEAYCFWCAQNGLKPMSVQKFGRDLSAKGYEKSKDSRGAIVYDGLRLRKGI